MRAVTAPELTSLRSSGQYSELSLAGLETPRFIFRARVDQSFPDWDTWDNDARDEILEIDYDSVTHGDIADVIPGMTLWIGSTPGTCDIGQARIRKAPTETTLYIGEESEIKWEDGLYLTVLDEFLLWPRHVKITDGTVYMDGDIEYDDQHEKCDPVPIMGSDLVLDLAEYPYTTAEGDLDSGDSWAHGSGIASHLWESSAGTWTDEDTSTPLLTIHTYPASGRIRLKCTVTTGLGASFSGYRYVYVYDADHRPETAFQLGSLELDVETSGWEAEILLVGDASEVRDRSKIIIFGNHYYAGQLHNMSQQKGRENILFEGYVDGETVDYDLQQNSTSFTVKGPQFWLDNMPGFPPGVEEIQSVFDWVSFQGLTVDKALWHLLHWRSTATLVLDFYKTGDARYSAGFEVPTDSIWGQMTEIAFTSILAFPGCDKFGRIFVAIDPQLTPVADRDFTEVMTLEATDWTGLVRIERKTIEENALLDLSGVAIPVPHQTALPIFVLAPGHIMSRMGQIETLDRLLLTSQAQANQLGGLVRGKRNNPYPAIEMDLASANFMLDAFPFNYVNVSIQPQNNNRGITLEARCLVRTITYEWDGQLGTLLPTLTLEAESFPTLAIKGDAPASSPIPPLPPPPPPIPPPWPGPGPLPAEGPHEVVIITEDQGVLYTLNFHEETPLWYFMNSGLSEEQYQSVIRAKRTLTNLIVIGCATAGGTNMTYLMGAYGCGGEWFQLASLATVDQGASGVDVGIVAFGVNEEAGEDLLMVAGGYGTHTNEGKKKVYKGTGGGFGMTDSSDLDLESLGGDVSFNAGEWFCTAAFAKLVDPPDFIKISAGGSVTVNEGQYPDDGSHGDNLPAWNWAGGGKIFVRANGGLELRIISGNDPSSETIVDVDMGTEAGSFAVSPSGAVLMASWSGEIARKSTDGGLSWSSIPASSPFTVGFDIFAACGDDFQFISATVQKVIFTPDAGATWLDKTGNLATVAPLCNIKHILTMAYEQ